jgi:hypothetical protein
VSYEIRHSDRQNDYSIVFINFAQTMLKVDIVIRSPKNSVLSKILNKLVGQVNWI